MSFWKGQLMALLFVLLMLALFGPIIWSGHKRIEAERLACEQRGGVQARAYDGHVCVQPR